MTQSNFPKTQTLGGTAFTFRLMTAQDRSRILYFAQHLSESDLLFMRRDVTQPEVVDAWVQDIENNRAASILVEAGDQIVAYGTLYFNQLFWSRHMGEIRVLVSSAYRGRGLGSRLVRELMGFARDMELEKVVTYLSVDDRGARAMVEEIGFRAEAILPDWVKTRDNRTHDLVIMGASMSVN